MLKQYSLKTVKGKINELIDTKNRIYNVPNFCINLPYLEKQILQKEEEHKSKKLTIILHEVYDNKTINLDITDDLKISEIKRKYAENNSIDFDKVKIRLLFGGSELQDDNFLYQYNINDGYIIQILKIDLC